MVLYQPPLLPSNAELAHEQPGPADPVDATGVSVAAKNTASENSVNSAGDEHNGGPALEHGKQKRAQKAKQPLSSKQQLSSTIKSVRDLLRKDAGLSGDTDRLPQLTWLLFLKNLDDFEQEQELSCEDEYAPVIEKPYRWRDWVIDKDVKSRKKGDELIKFVKDDLFPYLRDLQGSDERDLRAIIATIFQGT